MQPTDKGRLFLEQAANIEQALYMIAQTGQNLLQTDFTVLTYHLDFSALAFEALCERCSSEGYTGRLRYQIVSSTDEVARMVSGGNGDLAIGLCPKSLYAIYKQKAEESFLAIEPICVYHMEMTCAKGHPILQDGAVRYELLSAYPGFSGVPRSSLEPHTAFRNPKLVGQARTTYVMDPGPMRYRLLKKTNGFLLSLPISDEDRALYGLESVPLEDTDISIFALFRKNSPKERLIGEYLRLCKDFA